MIFDLFQYPFYRSKIDSGVLGAPIESILSETINMHPFCGNEKKKPIFHVDLIEFDHKTIPDFRFFQYLFMGLQMFLEYWGHLSEVF